MCARRCGATKHAAAHIAHVCWQMLIAGHQYGDRPHVAHSKGSSLETGCSILMKSARTVSITHGGQLITWCGMVLVCGLGGCYYRPNQWLGVVCIQPRGMQVCIGRDSRCMPAASGSAVASPRIWQAATVPYRLSL